MATKYTVADPTNYVGAFDETNEIDGDDKGKDNEEGLSWWERRSKYGPGIEGGGAVGLLLCSLTRYTFTQSFLRTQTGKKVRTKRFRRGGGGGEKARTL